MLKVAFRVHLKEGTIEEERVFDDYPSDEDVDNAFKEWLTGQVNAEWEVITK